MRLLGIALFATLAIGCGNDSRVTGDGGGDDGDGGGSDDGGIELDADPNVRGPVTVHVVNKTGAPVANLDAVFIDTDSTVTHVQTDAAGMAQASVFPGASVTVSRGRDTGTPPVCSYSLTTVQSLVPNDTITLVSAAPTAVSNDDPFSVRVVPLDPTAAGSFTFTYPAYSGPGFSKYYVYTSCGRTDVGTSTSPALPFLAGCARATMDVVVVAVNGAETPLAYTSKTGIAFTGGGSTSITDAWQAPSALAATYTNPTTRVSRIELDRFAPYVRGLATATGTAATAPFTINTTTSKPAHAVMKTRFTCPEATGDCITTNVGTAMQTITQVVDGTSGTYDLDVGANLLPWISAVYKPLTTTLEVTVTGSGSIDLFEANLRYTRTNASCSAGAVIYTWRVFGAAPGNVVFPTLPTAVRGDPTVRPSDAQSAFQTFLCESDAINGYRGAIKNVYEALGTCEMSGQTSPINTKPLGGTTNRLSQWN